MCLLATVEVSFVLGVWLPSCVCLKKAICSFSERASWCSVTKRGKFAPSLGHAHTQHIHIFIYMYMYIPQNLCFSPLYRLLRPVKSLLPPPLTHVPSANLLSSLLTISLTPTKPRCVYLHQRHWVMINVQYLGAHVRMVRLHVIHVRCRPFTIMM